MRQDVRRLLPFLLLAISSPLFAQQSQTTFVFADFLYWQMREVSDENWAQYITPSGAEQTATLYDAPFDMNPGFRVGAGYLSPQKTWDTTFYYTYFTTEAENHAQGDIFSAYLGNFFAYDNTDGANFGPFYDSAKIDWDFSFQTFDLEFGRHFEIDKLLKLRPFVGLKAAIIDQDIDSHWYGPKETILGVIEPITAFSTASEKITQDFWGIGPALGVDTTWSLHQKQNQSVNLIGNVSGALMWGHWSFSDVYENNTPDTITVSTEDYVGADVMARGVLGLEWAHHSSQYDLKIRLSYETQVWLNQMQYYVYNMGWLDNLMSLQGGNLGFYLNF